MKTHVFLLLIIVLSFSLDASARENDNPKSLNLKNESEQESRTERKSERKSSPKPLDSLEIKSQGIQKAPYYLDESPKTNYSSFIQDGPFTYYATPGPKLYSKQEWDSFPTQLRMHDYSRADCGNYPKSAPPCFGFTRHLDELPPPPMLPTYSTESLDPKTSEKTPAKKSNEK
ncbi:MAG: hypothetical protein SFY67_07795 [Candidatus Melainabacteria bacterium]|nr:hypothetical protein [Candidatus Melainabacteria bacterium]